MNIFETVAYGNPKGALQLVNSKGGKPQDQKHLAVMLATIVKKEGENGLAQIVDIHPHKELIWKFHKINKHSNCGGGCNGNCNDKKSNACDCSSADCTDVPEPKPKDSSDFSVKELYNQHQTLILGIAAIAVLAYIFKR